MFRAGAILMAVVVVAAGAATLAAGLGRDGGGGDGDKREETAARTVAAPIAKAAEEKKDSADEKKSKDEAPAVAAGTALGEMCRVGAPPVALPEQVRESSGVAVSRRGAGVFWTHNDSGDPALHAVDAGGKLLGTVRVEGARVVDWEDVASGPCPAGNCLYVADIGDNEAKRPEVVIYRLPEPAPGDAASRPAEALRARYPDGPHDAEAMFVLPGGEVHLITKGETGSVALYRLPASARPGQVATLELVREIAPASLQRKERITGASASRDGRWVAVRTLERVRIYDARELISGGGGLPREVDLAALNEPQGEGVAFGEGGALVLTSEAKGKKDPGILTRLACTLE